MNTLSNIKYSNHHHKILKEYYVIEIFIYFKSLNESNLITSNEIYTRYHIINTKTMLPILLLETLKR